MLINNRIFIFVLLFVFSPISYSGPFTDKLSICLINKTSESDKELLIQWIYAAMSKHPSVDLFSNVSPNIGNKLNQKTAKLFTDLIVDRCRQESKEALKYEESIALESSFELLGKVAMQGIMSHPNVGAYLGELQKHFDEKKLESVMPK